MLFIVLKKCSTNNLLVCRVLWAGHAVTTATLKRMVVELGGYAMGGMRGCAVTTATIKRTWSCFPHYFAGGAQHKPSRSKRTWLLSARRRIDVWQLPHRIQFQTARLPEEPPAPLHAPRHTPIHALALPRHFASVPIPIIGTAHIRPFERVDRHPRRDKAQRSTSHRDKCRGKAQTKYRTSRAQETNALHGPGPHGVRTPPLPLLIPIPLSLPPPLPPGPWTWPWPCMAMAMVHGPYGHGRWAIARDIGHGPWPMDHGHGPWPMDHGHGTWRL